MKNPKCPKCNSTNLATEKRPDGNAKCLFCGWYGKYSLCFIGKLKTSEEIVKEIERKISQEKEVMGYVSNPISHYIILRYELLLSWITQENNLDGLADD